MVNGHDPELGHRVWGWLSPRVTILENFASYTAVQELYISSPIGYVLKYSDTACVNSSSVSWCLEVTSLHSAYFQRIRLR